MILPICLQKYAYLIDDVSDERNAGDGYWVYLAPGHWHPGMETHCIHETSPAACAREMKTVEHCPCCPGKGKLGEAGR